MDRIDELTGIVRREVEDYASGSWNATMHPISDEERQSYAVITVTDRNHVQPFRTLVTVMARVVGDTVIIDGDITDRPLVNELVRAGIPREKIVLLYAGEQVPGQDQQDIGVSTT
ncbi:MAG: XisI protein [Burkholderiales bacterium]|nr:XisI protein [Anaerolineae bacterium]